MNPNKLLKSVLLAAALAATIFTTSVAQAKDITVAQVKATVGYVQEYNLALLAYMQDPAGAIKPPKGHNCDHGIENACDNTERLWNAGVSVARR